MKNVVLYAILGVVLLVAVTGIGWTWASYKWCDYGFSLGVLRKTGVSADPGQYATDDQMGIEEGMLGPGRHFLNPWTYSTVKGADIHIPARQIGLITNKVGKPLRPGQRLADQDQKGAQRMVLTPGLWRVNTFGQEVKRVSATIIKPGYVGVQTLLEDDPSHGLKKGVQQRVLQAGYYNVNPFEVSVKPVEIGYRVWDVAVEYRKDPQGNDVVVKGSGVSFPLADGKQMDLDITVVWGIFPEDAPRMSQTYGSVEEVETKVIEPQVQSICKNVGSNLTTQQFIEGETREEFQRKVTESLKRIGKEKGIHFLIALVRGFHPATDVRETIQAEKIAAEEKKTLKFEEARDTVAAELEAAKRKVDVATKDFDAETLAIVEGELELGLKQAAEIRAGADRTVANLKMHAAEVNAQIVKTLGQADADVVEATKKAEAIRLKLLIEAYGGAESYNLATFAESLPDDMSIEFRYAGEGTFWTDTKNNLGDLSTKKILSWNKKDKPAAR